MPATIGNYLGDVDELYPQDYADDRDSRVRATVAHAISEYTTSIENRDILAHLSRDLSPLVRTAAQAKLAKIERVIRTRATFSTA